MRLSGDDTHCVVTILDEDRPGIIGFKQRFVEVRRKDKVALVYLERLDGSDGKINCLVRTVNKGPGGVSKNQGEPDKDYVQINQRYDFEHNVTEVPIKVEMPDCSEQDQDDVITFGLEISEALPEGVKISKKNICFIDIHPDD